MPFRRKFLPGAPCRWACSWRRSRPLLPSAGTSGSASAGTGCRAGSRRKSSCPWHRSSACRRSGRTPSPPRRCRTYLLGCCSGCSCFFPGAAVRSERRNYALGINARATFPAAERLFCTLPGRAASVWCRARRRRAAPPGRSPAAGLVRFVLRKQAVGTHKKTMKELSFAQSIANRHLQRDQERLLATLLNQLDGMVYRCRDDAHWTMEFVSVGCFALTGYRPEELLLNYRVSYEEVTHPEDRERVRESIHAAIAERRRFDLEYRIVRADGTVRWVWERGVGIFREDGSLEAIQGVIDDVTPRKENERIVRDAELRYRSIVENAVEGFFQTTLEGAYLNVNPALVQIYGYDSADELKQAFSDIGRQLYVDPNRRAEFMREIRRHGVVNSFESQVFRKNGEVIWITENAREVRDATGNPAYYEGTVENITERKSYETRLSHQATHDGLTGLPNRLLFADRLQQAMPLAEREGMRLAVVFVDLDNFKYINDSLGHEAGDELIRVMARRLQACTRDSDTVARLGGDEFVLLLQGQHVATAAISIAMSRILTIVGAPVRIQDREFTLTCSVGVSVYPDDGKDVDTLLKHADAAMYQAKQVGRNNFQFFTPMLNQRVIDRMDIEHRLRHAVERDEFLLHYQPRFDLRSRSVVGAEALIRWKAPQG